jgi:hypothetical protein
MAHRSGRRLDAQCPQPAASAWHLAPADAPGQCRAPVQDWVRHEAASVRTSAPWADAAPASRRGVARVAGSAVSARQVLSDVPAQSDAQQARAEPDALGLPAEPDVQVASAEPDVGLEVRSDVRLPAGSDVQPLAG